jgi:flagellar biogenesis protein FliO
MVALIAQLALVTSIVVGFLLLVYFALKQNPRLLQGFTLSAMLPTPHADSGLVIESRLPLDARKSLMVIRAGEERYLVGATVDRIDAITRMGDHTHPSQMVAPYQQPVVQNTHAEPDPRPVGLSRFGSPAATSVSPAAPIRPLVAQSLPAQSLPAQALPPQTLAGSFQQQLKQVAQATTAQQSVPPQPVIPAPRRQTRSLNRLS